MRFGIRLSGPAAEMPALALAAERAGAESVWLDEHLAWPVRQESVYPYAADGAPPVVAGYPTHDPWVVLGGGRR